MKAPGLNVIKQERFVVVPSGKTTSWGQSALGADLFLISLITWSLLLWSSRCTRIGCAARTSAPINGILAFSTRDTALGNPRTKKTKASKKVECGPQTNKAAYEFIIEKKLLFPRLYM